MASMHQEIGGKLRTACRSWISNPRLPSLLGNAGSPYLASANTNSQTRRSAPNSSMRSATQRQCCSARRGRDPLSTMAKVLATQAVASRFSQMARLAVLGARGSAGPARRFGGGETVERRRETDPIRIDGELLARRECAALPFGPVERPPRSGGLSAEAFRNYNNEQSTQATTSCGGTIARGSAIE
jgi:hypothetical protein